MRLTEDSFPGQPHQVLLPLLKRTHARVRIQAHKHTTGVQDCSGPCRLKLQSTSDFGAEPQTITLVLEKLVYLTSLGWSAVFEVQSPSPFQFGQIIPVEE